MTELNPEAATPQVLAQEPSEEKKPSKWRTLIDTHPRAAKAAKLTAAGAALVAGTRVVTNAQHNKAKLNEALDHAAEAGDAFTDAVTVNPDES